MLQKYVYRELVLTFLLCFVAFSGVIFLGFGLHQLHFYKDLGLAFLIQVLPNFFPLVMSFTLPVALLTACTFTYGRMAGDRELDAIRSCGISLARIVWPGILLGIICSLASLLLYQDLIPEARFASRRVTRNALQKLVSAPSWGFRDIKLGSSLLHFKSVENGEFRKIVLVRFAGEEIQEILLAERCRFALDRDNGTLVAELHDCSGQRRKATGDGVQTDSGFFGTVIRPIQVDSTANKPKGIADMTSLELEILIGVPFATRYTPYELLSEYHRRFSMAFAPLVFALVGSTLGIATRRGSKLAGLGVTTIPVLLVYYPVTMLGNQVGQKGHIPPILAMWLPNLLIAGIGLVILWWTLRR